MIADPQEVAYWLSNFTLARSKCQGQCHSQFDCEKFDTTVMLHFAVCQRVRCDFMFEFDNRFPENNSILTKLLRTSPTVPIRKKNMFLIFVLNKD